VSREFRFSSHRLLELLASAKCPAKESELKWKDRGSSGKELRLALDLVDGPFAGFELRHCPARAFASWSYRVRDSPLPGTESGANIEH
jgi:hypothetical protein